VLKINLKEVLQLTQQSTVQAGASHLLRGADARLTRPPTPSLPLSSSHQVLKINLKELLQLTQQSTVQAGASHLLRGADARLTRPPTPSLPLSSSHQVLKVNLKELLQLTQQSTVQAGASHLLRGADARLTRPPTPSLPLSSSHQVLKINLKELLQLTQQSTVQAGASHLLRGADARLTRPNAAIAITDGGRPAMLFSHSGAWQLKVPPVKCVNPIGAGDVCTGVCSPALSLPLLPAPSPVLLPRLLLVPLRVTGVFAHQPAAGYDTPRSLCVGGAHLPVLPLLVALALLLPAPPHADLPD
jgi:flagellar motor switch/type III secretory pathway protein FliN